MLLELFRTINWCHIINIVVKNEFRMYNFNVAIFFFNIFTHFI